MEENLKEFREEKAHSRKKTHSTNEGAKRKCYEHGIG